MPEPSEPHTGNWKLEDRKWKIETGVVGPWAVALESAILNLQSSDPLDSPVQSLMGALPSANECFLQIMAYPHQNNRLNASHFVRPNFA